MLIFISQLSFLSWMDGKLYIDPDYVTTLSRSEQESITNPIIRTRNIDQDLEIQQLFDSNFHTQEIPVLKDPIGVNDIVFTEGKKIRVSHLRTERNQKVIRYYFENVANAALCNICEFEVRNRYPWVNNLIEVHHILPLSSPLQIGKDGTSMNDLVGVCPNCHRATHAFYRSYLVSNDLSDFTSSEHARDVFNLVKSSYVPV
jgi:predicted HNH restriction endonuclease